ncbi:carboxypeptidase regulatory-like domain-containing protein [Paludibaculum fermentans]|uniref:TonB-dependent receptor n=1 Tax=Paludibaculum fermentans TaxID=1473598 RepID=UPI003EBC8D82
MLQSSVGARLFLAACLLSGAAGLYAQTLGSIAGEVRDTSGAAIPETAITVINTGTNAQRSAFTNEAGGYAFPSLPPGIYTVKAERAGFKTLLRTQVEIQVQQNARLDFELPLGQVSESVEVVASPLMVNENATVGTVIENKRIVELPLNGRNYLQLVSLAPNVSTGFSTQGQAGARQGGIRASQTISVAGQRTNFNHYTLDGVENTDPNFNTFVVMPSVDALQEFKVQTGIYPAEFGRQTTQINVLTKSGTNQYHGTVFEFLRNDKLDATSYAFTSLRPVKDPFKWNQYGFTLAGPVLLPRLFNGKDKLFFMGNYESFRKRGNTTGLFSLAPTAFQNGDYSALSSRIYDPLTRTRAADGTLTGTPFAGNVIPANRISPTSKKLLEFYQNPTLPGVTNNYVQALARPQNRDQFIVRLDYNESPKSSWAGRYSWGDENESSPGLNQNGTKLVTNLEQYMGSNTRTLSPSMVTETRFGYTRFYNSVGTLLAFQRNVVDELSIPGLKGGDPVSWGIPSIGIANYQGIGDSTDGPFENKNSTLQFLNNTSITKGRHSFRFGGEVRRDQFNQVGNQFGRGSFSFAVTPTQDPRALTAGSGLPTQGDAFASFLLGNVTLTEVAAQIAAAQFRATSFALYFDDVWKLSPQVTLSLGLRYENTPPWEDISGNLTTVFFNAFDNTPNVADQSRYPVFLRQGLSSGDPYSGLRVRWPNIPLVQDGRLGNRLVNRDNNDFAPRIGLAWSPTSKWVIRTGAGMFYNQDQGNPRFDVARNAAGRTRNDDNSDFPTVTWATGAAALSGSVANILTPQAFSNKYDRRTPYSMQWLFNVQRELAKDLSFEAGYLASVSRHLESYRGVSASVPGPGSNASRSPYPNWGLLVLVENGGRGNYNSLGTKLTKRYSSGLTALVSYTWSKSIDTTSGIRTSDSDSLFSQDGRCMLCDRGLSAFDNRHRLVISGLYDVPFGKGRKMAIRNGFLDALAGGWQVGGISTWRSGFHINPSAGVNRANTNINTDRPDASGQSVNLDTPTTERWFNTAAFILQPVYQFGNAARNSVPGPAGFMLDSNVQKNFRLPFEGHELQFRWECYNLFNHPVWGFPTANLSSANFGRITSTAVSMRQMQFALKYVF